VVNRTKTTVDTSRTFWSTIRGAYLVFAKQQVLNMKTQPQQSRRVAWKASGRGDPSHSERETVTEEIVIRLERWMPRCA